MPNNALVEKGRAILNRAAADCGLSERPPIFVNPKFAAVMRDAGFEEGVDFVESRQLPTIISAGNPVSRSKPRRG